MKHKLDHGLMVEMLDAVDALLQEVAAYAGFHISLFWGAEAEGLKAWDVHWWGVLPERNPLCC